jgi:hypothetical protein
MRWGPVAALLWLAACAPLEERFAEACRGRDPAGGSTEVARCVEERRITHREHTSQAVRALLSAPEQRIAIAGRG